MSPLIHHVKDGHYMNDMEEDKSTPFVMGGNPINLFFQGIAWGIRNKR